MFQTLISLAKALSGGYLGWGIGANDAGNIFGPHVGSNLLRFRTCIWIFAAFVLLGAVTPSGQSMVTEIGEVMPRADRIEELASWEMINLAVLVALAAALALNIASWLGMPVSTSQGAIGSFFGLSLGLGVQHADLVGIPPWDVMGRMVGSWVISPFLAAIVGFLIQELGSRLVNRLVTNERNFNRMVRGLLLVAGAYGSYVLGATHAGIVVAPFFVAGIFEPWLGLPASFWAAGFGGVTIAVGGLTYSKNVIRSVGTQITTLDPFSAFSTVVAMSICLDFFKYALGVPVSSSQAVVGAVAGVGLTKGTQAVSFSTLRNIVLGWVATITFPALVTGFIYWTAVQLFG